MAKRNQYNINLDESEAAMIGEFCRLHDRTPQWLFKAGAQRLIDEDIQERKADLMTIQSWREINSGLSEPINDLLEMIAEDKEHGDIILLEQSKKVKRSA